MRILVIGQGLAGTLVSHFGLQRGWDVHVIDAGYPSASSVAAGMFNPMSFRRIVEVWEAEEHLNIMRKTFAELESITATKLLHDLPIHKRLANAEYAGLWQDQTEHLKWLLPPTKCWPEEGVVEGGGWVNLPLLLSTWRTRLIDEGRFEQRPYQDDDGRGLSHGTWDAVVDCRGTATGLDTQMPQLDIRANRGELLTVEQQAHSINPPDAHILNFGKWTIPTSAGQWRLGASYEWNRTDLDPTAGTQQFLLNALDSAVPGIGQLKVTQHLVGLRPVSRDRRPAVGPYPGLPGWFVLNGLGTRGVLIGPRWALHLMNIIAGDSTATTETQPNRLIFG